MKIFKKYSLKKFTSMGIGGPARFFAAVKNEDELYGALDFASQKKIPWYVVGSGSNLIVSDEGFEGVIIQNMVQKFDLSRAWHPPQAWGGAGRGRTAIITLGAGNNLTRTIFKLNRGGLAGLERMAGIAGTVGGAIFGCAGAYGQEIKDHLLSVRVWDGKKFKNLKKTECKFGYRSSIFKSHKNWVITSALFRLKKGSPKRLIQISREIIKLRAKKYPPGLRCPGSFFKNIRLSDLPAKSRGRFLKKISKNKVMYGKVPVGFLLEEIGAKGMPQGGIKVAAHHANLIYNPGGGKARDVKKLASHLKKLVKNKFGIIIEEEVQYLTNN